MKSNFYRKFHADEAATIKLLGTLGSEACRVSGELRLGRPLLREIMTELCGNRTAQATLASVICGTRFKYFEKANMLHTTCQRRIGQPQCICGEVDSLELLLQGAELEEAHADAPELVLLLAELARRASDSNPGNVSPVYQLEIALENTSEENANFDGEGFEVLGFQQYSI